MEVRVIFKVALCSYQALFLSIGKKPLRVVALCKELRGSGTVRACLTSIHIDKRQEVTFAKKR
jgi:hypothetical protein